MTFTKQEREQNKAILLAVLNYLLDYHAEDMVFDDYSPSKQWYLSDLRQTELDIQKSRSYQIKRRLDMHLALLRNKYDLNINTYILENTGYDIDIYEEYKTQILPIILKGHISHNDIYPVAHYLEAYRADPQEHERITLLKVLLAQRDKEFTRAIEANGLSHGEVVTQRVHIVQQGKKSWIMDEASYKESEQNWLLYEISSPNENASLSVQFSGKGSTAITYVNISLKGGTGAICSFRGEKLPIKAYWESDYRVIIAYNIEYDAVSKYSEVKSYGETINIEYRSTLDQSTI